MARGVAVNEMGAGVRPSSNSRMNVVAFSGSELSLRVPLVLISAFILCTHVNVCRGNND